MVAVLVIALAMAGCDIFGPQACRLVAEPAVSVAVVDSVSGDPVLDGVRVIARSGAFADTVDTGTSNPVHLAHERPGIYHVTVESPDHAIWQRQNVQVEDGECHVRTVELTARLQPS